MSKTPISDLFELTDKRLLKLERYPSLINFLDEHLRDVKKDLHNLRAKVDQLMQEKFKIADSTPLKTIGLSFSEALSLLKQDKKVSRWGSNTFIWTSEGHGQRLPEILIKLQNGEYVAWSPTHKGCWLMIGELWMNKKLVSILITVLLISLYLMASFLHFELLKSTLFGLCFGWTLFDVRKKIKKW